MSNSYSSLKTMFRDAMENDDEAMLKALITNIVPLSSASDQAYVQEVIAVEASKSKIPWIRELFISSFPPNDISATNFLLGCLDLSWTRRESLNVFASALTSNYGNVLLSAFFKGDLEMVELLKSIKRPAPVISIDGRHGRFHADGIEITHQLEEMANFKDSLDFKKIMSLLVETLNESKFDVIEFISEFCDKYSFNKALEKTEPVPFEGEIPRIESGIIHNPELLIAFGDQHSKSALPKMYGRVFAYVRPEEVQGVNEIRLYETVRRVSSAGIEVSEEAISRAGATTELVDLKNGTEPKPLIDRIPTIDLHTKLVINVKSEDDSQLKREEDCRCKMLTDAQFMGLDIPIGFCLASIDVKSLERFALGHIDRELMRSAFDYASGFFPAELLSTYCSYPYRRNNRDEVNNMSAATFFNFASKSSDSEKIFSSLDPGFWINIFKGWSRQLSAESILMANSRFGLTNEDGPGFSISEDKLSTLYEAGYKFTNGSKGCYFESKRNGYSADYYRKLISMNGWPSDIERPVDCYAALKSAVKNKDRDLYEALIRHHGPEESVKAAKTPSQYARIMEIFSQDELKPFVSLMPLRQMGQIFSKDLGM